MTVLVCDLGGTGCRMALARRGVVLPDTYRAMQNLDYSNFEDALLAYLKAQNTPTPTTAVVALAAPIDGDEIALSNHIWRLSKSHITAETGIATVLFLNDLQALGHALRRSGQPESQSVLSTAAPPNGAMRLVIGVGTGFNSAACTSRGNVVSSETGHTTFPVETWLDTWLRAYFAGRHGRCSLERVLSGSGLGAIHQGVCAEVGKTASTSNSHEIIAAANAGDPLAQRTCAEFCRILGRAAGDLALIFLPYGGIWLAGGISQALASTISDPNGPFLKAFRAKGRMSSDMASFPVWILKDDLAALQGCLTWYGEHAGSEDRQSNFAKRAM